MIKIENKNNIANTFFENGSCPDIQAHILSFIDNPRDKVLFGLVSKACQRIVKDTQELAWTIAGQVSEEEVEKWVGKRLFANYSGYLDLSRSNLNNDKLKEYASIFPNLTWLNLSNALDLTSNGLRLLQNLPHLKMLDLSKCNSISTQGLDNLRYVSKLEELNLSDMKWVDDKSLIQVFNFCTNLKKIAADSCSNITSELFVQSNEKSKHAPYSQVISNLEFLSLYGCRELKQINFVHKMALKYLNLTGCLLGNIDFIKKCNQLEYLILDKTTIADISPIASNLTNLKSLKLTGCEIDNHEPFGHLTTLEYLDPPNSFAKSLKELAPKLVKLKEIRFYYSLLKLEHIVDLAKMSGLQSILFPSVQMFKSEYLKPLSSLKSLKKITAQIQDPIEVYNILPQLKEFKQLEGSGLPCHGESR